MIPLEDRKELEEFLGSDEDNDLYEDEFRYKEREECLINSARWAFLNKKLPSSI